MFCFYVSTCIDDGYSMDDIVRAAMQRPLVRYEVFAQEMMYSIRFWFLRNFTQESKSKEACPCTPFSPLQNL